ncbi:MAG: hypothetical protein LAT65_17275 [Saccharospirillum sp.]|nr:hypothetical protein [Saccharospirillum sp.]
MAFVAVGADDFEPAGLAEQVGRFAAEPGTQFDAGGHGLVEPFPGVKALYGPAFLAEDPVHADLIE